MSLSSSVAKFCVKVNYFETNQLLGEHVICCAGGVAKTTFLTMKYELRNVKNPLQAETSFNQ